MNLEIRKLTETEAHKLRREESLKDSSWKAHIYLIKYKEHTAYYNSYASIGQITHNMMMKNMEEKK